MKLFIGNATRQVMDFRYIALGTNAPRSVKIQPGSQVQISGERGQPLSTEEVDNIVRQHEKYGLIPQERIDQCRTFHGTCFAIDKPITATRLVYLMNTNLDQLVMRGEEIRKANAVAHSNGVNAVLASVGREELPAMELTIQQENKDATNAVPQLSEGLLVTTDAEAVPLSRGRRRAA